MTDTSTRDWESKCFVLRRKPEMHSQPPKKSSHPLPRIGETGREPYGSEHLRPTQQSEFHAEGLHPASNLYSVQNYQLN